MSMQQSTVGASDTTAERDRQQGWQILNTCNLNDGSKGREGKGKGGEGGRTAGKTNSKEAVKCAADAGKSTYAQRLSAIHLMVLVPL